MVEERTGQRHAESNHQGGQGTQWAVAPKIILRKILGPLHAGDNTWGIQSNTELYLLTNGAHIVRFITAQTIRCLGHVQRTDTTRMAKGILEWKPMWR